MLRSQVYCYHSIRQFILTNSPVGMQAQYCQIFCFCLFVCLFVCFKEDRIAECYEKNISFSVLANTVKVRHDQDPDLSQGLPVYHLCPSVIVYPDPGL